MLSACSYVYADKFTACVQNVACATQSMRAFGRPPEHTHALSRTRHWSMDASMTFYSLLLQTFSTHCCSS